MKSLKLQILALTVLLGFSSAIVAPRPAHAIIGLAASASAVRTAGGITLLGGGVITGASLVIGLTAGASNLAEALVVVIMAAYGIAIGTVTAGIGLIILDADNGQADLTFLPVDPTQTDLLAQAQVTPAMVEIYNTETEELNAARQSIDAEIARTGGSVEDAKVLWESIRSQFQPESITVASHFMDLMFSRAAALAN